MTNAVELRPVLDEFDENISSLLVNELRVSMILVFPECGWCLCLGLSPVALDDVRDLVKVASLADLERNCRFATSSLLAAELLEGFSKSAGNVVGSDDVLQISGLLLDLVQDAACALGVVCGIHRDLVRLVV